MVEAEIAAIVRQHEETVRRWSARSAAEGPAGLADIPQLRHTAEGLVRLPSQSAGAYEPAPTRLGPAVPTVDCRPAGRLFGRRDRPANGCAQCAAAPAGRWHGAEPAAAHHHQSQSRRYAQERTVEDARDERSGALRMLVAEPAGPGRSHARVDLVRPCRSRFFISALL